MGSQKYDLIVIGSGPSGEGAAMHAVKAGRRVLLVEKHTTVGGACTFWGTIPSKALLQVIEQIRDFREHPILKDGLINLDLSYPRLLSAASSVIERQSNMRAGFYDRNQVDVIHGTARFLSGREILVEQNSGKDLTLSADHFVIATGSRPWQPPDIPFDGKYIFDSNSILEMDKTPRVVTVYGAGVIGCEYASIFRNLGCKVNLVNNRDRLLSFLDHEIADALSYHLRDQGALIRNEEVYEKVEARDNQVRLHLKSGKVIKSDILLWANGRTGNSDQLGLENISSKEPVKTNQRGQIQVNENYQTSAENIYAVGDIVGYPALASTAYNQGRFAASHLIDGVGNHLFLENLPTGIYTSPEISCIGRSEQELTAERIPYEVGHSFFRHLARAQISGRTTGMLKILFHRETLEVLGVHCFGNQASEIVHIGQAVMSRPGNENTIEYFVNNTFNYPTMAEAYRVAALNGLNRL